MTFPRGAVLLLADRRAFSRYPDIVLCLGLGKGPYGPAYKLMTTQGRTYMEPQVTCERAYRETTPSDAAARMALYWPGVKP